MGKLLVIFFGGVLLNNFILSRFLGICPFIGISQRVETAAGMSAAVIFVMVLPSSNVNTFDMATSAAPVATAERMPRLVSDGVSARLNTYIEIITGITEPPRFRLIVQRPRYMGISTKPPTRINKTATKACLSLRCMRSRTLWASPRKTTTLTASSRISPTVMLKPPSSVETASLPHPGK
jgi:hypothetical protein